MDPTDTFTRRLDKFWKHWDIYKVELTRVGSRSQVNADINVVLTTHFARNLGFIFDEPLPSGTKLLHFLNLATVTFVNFVAWVEGREMSLGDTAEASR